MKLKGSTKRAGNPALHAHLAMAGMGPSGANEAGLAYSRVALPKTLFLDNAHIGTVCTRVQFKRGAVEGEKCPAGSIIGSAKAVTPILDAPLEGPIYLRSNPERELPDIAASLQGQEISVVAVGHTDSAPGGGLRNTFEVIPDAPIDSRRHQPLRRQARPDRILPQPLLLQAHRQGRVQRPQRQANSTTRSWRSRRRGARRARRSKRLPRRSSRSRRPGVVSLRSSATRPLPPVGSREEGSGRRPIA